MEEQTKQNQKRQVACITKISDIINGSYVKDEGWNPNYILTQKGKRMSRVNIIAAVREAPVEEDVSYKSLIIDDGSGKIALREFQETGILNSLNVGQIINVIGRPREYGQEKYILPEIIKPVDNTKWIEVRKLQLRKQELEEEDLTQNAVAPMDKEDEPITSGEEEVVMSDEDTSAYEKVLECVKEIDTGDGAETQQVISRLGNDSEKIIQNLLKEGELYEISPGKVKIL